MECSSLPTTSVCLIASPAGQGHPCNQNKRHWSLSPTKPCDTQLMVEMTDLTEMIPATRRRLVCCEVGTCVSISSRLRTLERWERFTSGKYLRHTSNRQSNCSPFQARMSDRYWPSLHITSCNVDSKPTQKVSGSSNSMKEG